MNEIRVQIVAVDPLARSGLAALLHDRPGLRLVEAEGLIQGEVDLLVYDLGWQFSREQARFRPRGGVPVLFLAPPGAELGSLLPFLSDPAVRGVLRRDRGAEDLEAAIAAAAHGLVVVDPAFLPAGGAAELPADPPRIELTPREMDVLRLVAEGLPNKAVAWRLELSEHTVKFHLNSLMTKLGAQSRTEVAVRAMRLGLLSM